MITVIFVFKVKPKFVIITKKLIKRSWSKRAVS